MTILVTGGTGLVGSRLLRAFVDAGVNCRALVRPGKEVFAGATPVAGDLLDVDSLKPAVEDCTAIVQQENSLPEAPQFSRAELVSASHALRNVVCQAPAHGLSRFQDVESVSNSPQGNNGLGPRFNSNSCSSCHSQPAVGGSGAAMNPQFAFAGGTVAPKDSQGARSGLIVKATRNHLRINEKKHICQEKNRTMKLTSKNEKENGLIITAKFGAFSSFSLIFTAMRKPL